MKAKHELRNFVFYTNGINFYIQLTRYCNSMLDKFCVVCKGIV